MQFIFSETLFLFHIYFLYFLRKIKRLLTWPSSDKIAVLPIFIIFMSVYTSFTQQQLSQLLSLYRLGEVENIQGIAAGITNTNYFLDTTTGRYVLTVFEQNKLHEMPFFMDLMAHLNKNNIPCAHPIATINNDYVINFEGKPVAIVERLQGATDEQPSVQKCQALGKALAEMHNASQSFTQTRKNDRGANWRRQIFAELKDKLNAIDYGLLKQEIDYLDLHASTPCFNACPKGIIHADLFPDNTLFDGEKLTGIIDYYYACNERLLYDIAVSVNGWCHLDESKSKALLSAYNKIRPFTNDEKQSWNIMLRAAALRFWLSRLHSVHFPIEGEMTLTKNPDEIREVLLYHINNQEKNTQLIAHI